MLLRACGLGLVIANSVVIARILGPDEYGIYAYVIAITAVLGLPAQMGIPSLLVRETARLHALSAWEELRGLWAWANKAIVKLSLISIGLGAAYISIPSEGLQNRPSLAFTLGLLLVPIIALANARGAMLRGLRLLVVGQIPESIIRPAILVVAVAVASYGFQLGARDVLVIQVAASLIAFVCGLHFLRVAVPEEVTTAATDQRSRGAWRKAVVPIALNSGLVVLNTQVGILVLGAMSPAADVGQYKVATSAATFSLFGLQTVGLVIGPHVSRLHAIGDAERVKMLAACTTLAAVGITIPSCAAFIFFGDRLLSILYGAGFAAAWGPLAILCVGQLILSLFASAQMLLLMSRNERHCTKWLFVAAVANLLACLALVPLLGGIGAAIGATLSTTIWTLGFWGAAKSVLGVDSGLLQALRYLPQLVRAPSVRNDSGAT